MCALSLMVGASLVPRAGQTMLEIINLTSQSLERTIVSRPTYLQNTLEYSTPWSRATHGTHAINPASCPINSIDQSSTPSIDRTVPCQQYRSSRSIQPLYIPQPHPSLATYHFLASSPCRRQCSSAPTQHHAARHPPIELATAPVTAVMAVALVMAAIMAVGPAGADFAADREECTDKLMGLATCLTYVQEKATARAPTPDCCAGFKTVYVQVPGKKCLCVLMKDRDEPALGFKYNVTRSMDLPSVCGFDATFSNCPQILKMSPDAKEAEIFKQYARAHESKNRTTAAAGGAGVKSASAAAEAAGAGRLQGSSTVFFGVVSALLASVVIGVS